MTSGNYTRDNNGRPLRMTASTSAPQTPVEFVPDPVDPATVVSPKVSAGAIGGAIAGAIGAGITAAVAAATPELVEGLGPWGGVVFAGVTVAAASIGQFLAGYATRDPLRRG